MEQEQMQDPMMQDEQNMAQLGDDVDLSDDEIAAALGFATTISDQNLQASQMAEEPIEEEEETAGKPIEGSKMPQNGTPEIEELKTQFEDFKAEVSNSIKTEIKEIKELLTEALKEEEPVENETKD